MSDEEENKVKLEVEAIVRTNKMHLRQQFASAKLPDGRDVSVCLCLGSGTVLFEFSREGESGWRTYCFSPVALTEAILAYEARKSLVEGDAVRLVALTEAILAHEASHAAEDDPHVKPPDDQETDR